MSKNFKLNYKYSLICFGMFVKNVVDVRKLYGRGYGMVVVGCVLCGCVVGDLFCGGGYGLYV